MKWQCIAFHPNEIFYISQTNTRVALIEVRKEKKKNVVTSTTVANSHIRVTASSIFRVA